MNENVAGLNSQTRGMNAPDKWKGGINPLLDSVVTQSDKGFIPLCLLPGAFMPGLKNK